MRKDETVDCFKGWSILLSHGGNFEFLPLRSLNFFLGYTLNTVLSPTASASLIPAEMGEFMPVYTALCAVLFSGFVHFFGFNCLLSVVFQGDLAHDFPESAN